MQLVTFGTDKDRNLIIQFPVFIQAYTQQPLILYQLETVPVPILDQSDKAQSYMHLQIQASMQNWRMYTNRKIFILPCT